MSLFRAQPWTRQPQIVTRMNWSHPSAAGLEIAVNPGIGLHPRELARGRSITYASNITLATGANTPGTSGTQRLLSSPFRSIFVPSASAGLTIPAWPNVTNEGSLLILQKGPGSSNYWLEIGSNSNADHFPYAGLIYTDAFWSSRWVNGVSNPPGLYMDDPVAVGLSVKAGSQRFLWDGVLRSSAANASTFTLPTTLRFGADGTQGFNGHFFLILVWSRALPDSELAELSRNPWQLFAPQRPLMFAPPASTTPTLSAATYMPGSLTSAGFRPRVTAT